MATLRGTVTGVQPLQHLTNRGLLALGQRLSLATIDDDVLHDRPQPL
ncbi:predicted protein [Streptomyces iranensis]|uniref:Uncharacterized protein n=1 Tax=Streptomyces iranensis TaxID=576784 RepID=A0A060ZT20_9ACTN|nr:predicted protein [Streptomyces iranensis]